MRVVSDFFTASVVVLTAGSAQHMLWVKLHELCSGDLCREGLSWLVPQKSPSPRSLAWIVCASQKRGERFFVVVATKLF